jgi:hypothetical protein
MNDDLETKINTTNRFKSAGEKKIAGILDKYGISFKYESPVIVIDNDKKQRIWYPDFYLPQFGIYLEFYGFKGNHDYDNSRRIKEQVFKNLGYEVINIDTTVPKENIDNHIINQIYKVQRNRYRKIRSSVYGLRTGAWSKY